MDTSQGKRSEHLVKPLLQLGEFVGFRIGVVVGLVMGISLALIALSPFLQFK